MVGATTPIYGGPLGCVWKTHERMAFAAFIDGTSILTIASPTTKLDYGQRASIRYRYPLRAGGITTMSKCMCFGQDGTRNDGVIESFRAMPYTCCT